jgi:hypothetical protein
MNLYFLPSINCECVAQHMKKLKKLWVSLKKYIYIYILSFSLITHSDYKPKWKIAKIHFSFFCNLKHISKIAGKFYVWRFKFAKLTKQKEK